MIAASRSVPMPIAEATPLDNFSSLLAFTTRATRKTASTTPPKMASPGRDGDRLLTPLLLRAHAGHSSLIRRASHSMRHGRAHLCHRAGVTFDLSTLDPSVQRRVADWDALALNVTVTPVSPNHGKAVAQADFVNAEWSATVIVWETGELELELGRLRDGWRMAKHYEVENQAQLDSVFEELIAAGRDGVAPKGAVIWRADQR